MGISWPRSGAAWEKEMFGFSAIQAENFFRAKADTEFDLRSILVDPNFKFDERARRQRRRRSSIEKCIHDMAHPRIRRYYNDLLYANQGRYFKIPRVFHLLEQVKIKCPNVEVLSTLGTMFDFYFGVDGVFRIRGQNENFCCIDVTVRQSKVGRHTDFRLIVSPADFESERATDLLATEIAYRIRHSR